MARKVQRLVLTDALCWIPTCICAYLYIAGVNLSDELYAYTAILILPINSCLNPIVYTDVIDQVHVWILKHVVKVGSDSFNSSPSVATMGDKVHNPVDQLTAIHEQSGVHSHTATSNDTNNHLQTTTLGPSEPTINTRSSLANLSPHSYHPQDGPKS